MPLFDLPAQVKQALLSVRTRAPCGQGPAAKRGCRWHRACPCPALALGRVGSTPHPPPTSTAVFILEPQHLAQHGWEQLAFQP